MLPMWLEWQDIFWPTLKALAALPSFLLLSTNSSGSYLDQFFLRKDDNDEFLFRCCCYPSASSEREDAEEEVEDVVGDTSIPFFRDLLFINILEVGSSTNCLNIA